ncbi:response regulator NasT [Desulfohalotomaculum tongense]|uniref:ANTAR domain-containing response regulator n=1 Tax=Desulforadius tongensis TaxID=1216062 RepID=UPI0019565C86|nr:ANTAR domain-containing protein [Desulforadius tongensis]MBM7854879.1 response regulator NasT [Desulforadius tongensis]
MGRRRIVAAESDASALEKLKEMIFRSGFNVVGEATDGITVLKLARTTQPDLVVLDAHLPGMDGLEVAKILEEESVVPSLLVAARAGRDLLEQVRDSYFISILIKPIRPQQLYTAVEQALANHGRFKKLERQLEDLKQTLESKKVIERAKAILMHTKNLSENEAHKLLQQISMKKRKSKEDIAMAVITAHELSKH